ncbi:hypothetical protein [Pseudoduganella lutea]|uniref:Uncharacterized protein n=1 Tax=Pseudoduganella lutea TaxID=321985 RepID=A0A4P6KYY8_9BURK|nr:hypothetical protein [Pseudoduganella lutea]QBE64270.1 hypothetical protein EWM63_15805 [Pseudoduganella lutea]
MARKNRISHALYLKDWDFKKKDIATLEETAEAIAPGDYLQEMKDGIFCPTCYTPLFRSPSDKPFFSNRRNARYNHYESFLHVPCPLRAPKAIALKYDSEELARQAVENGELAVVHSFQTAAPDVDAQQVGAGGVGYYQDADGPVGSYPISRHKGESFRLPTKISAVSSICRRFDLNLNKYYLLPGRAVALPLTEELLDLATITEEDPNPRLYFAKILHSDRMGANDVVHLRMTYFKCNPKVKDFCLKATIAEQREKGIDDEVRHRYVLIWGAVTASGIGLCINRPKWGEYALLPQKYEPLLPIAEESSM